MVAGAPTLAERVPAAAEEAVAELQASLFELQSLWPPGGVLMCTIESERGSSPLLSLSPPPLVRPYSLHWPYVSELITIVYGYGRQQARRTTFSTSRRTSLWGAIACASRVTRDTR